MLRKFKVFLFFSVLILAALACASFGSSPDTSPEEPNILFQDDFSSSTSGWEDIYRDSDGISDYDQDGFRLQINQPQFDYWANPGLSFTDVSIEVDAQKIGGPEDNDFGLICRYTDESNFYFFLATSDGYYAIGKNGANGQTLLGSDFFEQTDQVRSGNAVNHLRADCVDSTLTFYINGTQVSQVSDTEHISGDVGLMAGTFDEPGTDILFDNFVVRKP
jgi:hypothetical protein